MANGYDADLLLLDADPLQDIGERSFLGGFPSSTPQGVPP